MIWREGWIIVHPDSRTEVRPGDYAQRRTRVSSITWEKKSSVLSLLRACQD